MMRDTTVTDCEGVLFDSELGPLEGHYDHNEDYTFSICIAGADEIILEFNYFQSEEQYDEIVFFDGPDATAPILAGPFSGSVDIPSIIATSGCLTVRFTSDANVAEPGWRAQWRTSNFSPPLPPELSVTSSVACPADEIELELSYPIHCDSLYPGAISLRGPKLVAIGAVTPIACTGDSTTRFRVSFTPALDFSGSYTLDLRVIIPYCTTPYILHTEAMFRMTGCPLAVRLRVQDLEELCVGGSTRVTAEVSGGLRNTYRYTWSPFASSEDTVRIGPITGPTLVRVDVVDAAGNAATAEVLVEPAESPEIIGGDRSMCQSVGLFELVADPPGGRWDADGLYYGYDANRTTYDPLLTDGIEDVITYEAPNGCVTSVTYSFTPLDPGTDDGACLGASPFDVSGGLPTGGRWTGPHIDDDGRFTPPGDTGTWTVTYTHPNGCAGSKEIHVSAPSEIAQDTFCESEPRVTLQIEPRGGVWTGPGMSFGSRGWFSPGTAGHGPHTLTYIAEGCGDKQVNIFVKEIDAFTGFTACPIEDPRILPGNWRPAGGTWYGRGIVEPSIGLFDPSIFGVGSDTLTYHAPNGCTDKRTASVYFTFTRPQNDTLELCTADVPLQLSPGGAIFQRPLDIGIWSGDGVVYDQDSTAYFDPRLTGPGIYQITYEANTCSAFNWIQVGQSPEWYGDTICVDSDPVQLTSQAQGTEWAGDGIINGVDGIFDVSVVGPGTYEVFAYSPEGCDQSANVYVPEDAQLSYAPVSPVLCYNSTPDALQLQPSEAIASINDGILSPDWSTADLGSGEHTVFLQVGEVGCEDFDTLNFTVLSPLSLSAKPYTDTLCEGDGTTLEIETTGGLENDWTVAWDDRPNWPIRRRQVFPTATTTYTASLSDGCSDDVQLEMPIHINPAVEALVSEGPIVCHYDTTYAIVEPLGNSTYEIQWTVPEPGFINEQYTGSPGTYDVTVVDTETGCQLELQARLPGWPVVAAAFSPNPENCVAPQNSEVILLDRSRGGNGGFWMFPDSTQRPYIPGQNEQVAFADTGSYQIKLLIENEGGCTAIDSAIICVEAPSKLYLPTAFTPNGDGTNDTYHIGGQGIYGIEWVIVDRWGTVVFAGDSMASEWDGTYKNELLQQGQFTLRAEYIDEFGARKQAQGIIWLMR